MRIEPARLIDAQSRAFDVALAAGVTVFNVASLIPFRSDLHPFGVALLLVAAQSVPLVSRRAHPIAVVSSVGIARVAYDVAGFAHAPFPLGPILAVFTVADLCRPRMRALTLAVLVTAILVSQLGSPHDQPYDLTVAVLIFLATWVAGIASRTRRAYLAEVEERARSAEADLDREAARAAAAERARIARELHDVVAHHVSVMAVQAEAAASLLPDRPDRASGPVEIIGATARETLGELRHLLGVLRRPDEPPELTPTASLAELEPLLQRLAGTGLHAELAVQGSPRRLPPAVDATGYRIIQEALTNVVRHSAASRALVTIAYGEGDVEVTVLEDDPHANGHTPEPSNGRGLRSRRPRPSFATLDRPAAPSTVGPSGGFGLAGIAERVAACGGNLRLGPTPDGRFCVSARLPT